MLSPNSYLFSGGGDGLKNYFTPAYYIKYNQGFEFTGMNYPNAEHILYTDAQPLLSAILRFIHHNIVPIANHTVGIINILMLLSIPIAVLLLFKILKHYKCPTILAFVGAICIGFMSPQINRFLGHYALAYSFYLPLVWYLIIKVNNSKKWIWPLFLAIVPALFAFIHPYYLAISLVFLAAYTLVNLITYKKLSALKFALIAVLPFVSFKLIMMSTDGVTDRPDNPYGIFTYIASIESVFLPNGGILKDFLFENFAIRKPNWEGFAYVGLLPIIAFVIAIIVKAKTLISRKNTAPLLPKNLRVVLLAGVLVLLFSMAIPLKWNLDFLLELVPPLKQFRGLGRFAWVFYYVATVTGLLLLKRLYGYLFAKNQLLAKCTLLVALGVMGFEAYQHSKTIATLVDNAEIEQPLFTEFEQWIDEAQINPSDYQALIVLPFFHIGSEEIYIEGTYHSTNNAYKATYVTGLPMVNTMMSRTSLSQTFEALELVNTNLLSVGTAQKLSSKPLLIMQTETLENKLEKQLVKQANPIAKYAHEKKLGTTIQFYKVETTALNSNQEKWLEDVTANNECGQDNTDPLNFEKNSFISERDNSFYNWQMCADSVKYVNASVWVKADHSKAAFPTILAEVKRNNKTEFTYEYNVKWSRIAVNNYVFANIDSIPIQVGDQLVLTNKHQSAVLSNVNVTF